MEAGAPESPSPWAHDVSSKSPLMQLSRSAELRAQFHPHFPDSATPKNGHTVSSEKGADWETSAGKEDLTTPPTYKKPLFVYATTQIVKILLTLVGL